MGYAALRGSLHNFFNGTPIPGLNNVFAAKPTFVSGQAFNLSYNGGNGAVAYLHFMGSSETRATLGAGTSGSKAVTTHVGLVVIYQYMGANQPGDDVDSWVLALDDILDGLKTLIRSDPTLGTGGTTSLFQGGQDGNDIVLMSQDAVIDRGKVLSWNALEFTVEEIIQA